MTIIEILHQYKDVEPKNWGDFGEKCYPVTTVIKAMEQWALQKQIEENKSILTMAELHMDERAVIVLKQRIFELERAGSNAV
jgi:hypothetical protein